MTATLAVLVQYPRLILLSNLIRRHIAFCLPSLNPDQDRSDPTPTFTSRKQAPPFHCSFISPRCIFASADLHISPPGFVCTLQPPGLIQSVSQNLLLLLKRQSVHPCAGPDRHVIHFIVITNACPQQTCWFGLQVSPLRLLSQFLHHLLQVRL